MLNHSTRYAWSLHHDALRPSLLGRRAARKAYPGSSSAGPDDDFEEAPRSRETDANVHAAIDALGTGAVGELARSIDDVIRSWRADNAAGGRAAFEHLPLPNELAKTMARMLGELEERERQPAFDNVISHLDPSSRMHIAQQVARSMGKVSGQDVKKAGAHGVPFETRPRDMVDPRLREGADQRPPQKVLSRGARLHGEHFGAAAGST